MIEWIRDRRGRLDHPRFATRGHFQEGLGRLTRQTIRQQQEAARKGPTPNAAAGTRKASSGLGGRRRDWTYSIAVILALGEVFGAADRWRDGGAVTWKGDLPIDW